MGSRHRQRQSSAPQARLMATVHQRNSKSSLPWRLVLMGVACDRREILGVRSLALPRVVLVDCTTGAMFAGGLVRWLVEATTKNKDESEAVPASLFRGLTPRWRLRAARGIIIALFGKTQRLQIGCRIGSRRPRSAVAPPTFRPSPADGTTLRPMMMPSSPKRHRGDQTADKEAPGLASLSSLFLCRCFHEPANQTPANIAPVVAIASNDPVAKARERTREFQRRITKRDTINTRRHGKR